MKRSVGVLKPGEKGENGKKGRGGRDGGIEL